MTGRPDRIYLSPPELLGAEREEVLRVLEEGWLAPAGPDLAAFERELAVVTGVADVAAVSSGTAALHLALHSHGIGAGDRVVVSSLTFVASANAVLYTGAVPVFVDADDSWNADPEQVLRAVAEHDARAVVLTDLYGHVADFDAITAECRRRGVLIVEDAAESLGASRNGRPGGSFGDIAALSFNGNKIITTTGGGAVACHSPEAAQRIRHLATQAKLPVAHYEHEETGFNYRLSNLLAAFGRAQLATLAERIERRRAVRDWYAELFARIPGCALNPLAAHSEPNHWLTCVTIDPQAAGFDAARLLDAFGAADIEARPIWKPLHLQPLFAGAPSYGGAVSERIFATGVTLPSGGTVASGGWHERIAAVVESVSAEARPG